MKQNRRPKVIRKKAKTVLRLPDLEYAKAAVLNSLTSLDAQRGYRHAIEEFVDWYCSEPRLALNRIVVLRYRTYLETRQLASGTINLRLGAVADWRMRPPKVVFSALILRLAFAESRVSRSWACGLEIG